MRAVLVGPESCDLFAGLQVGGQKLSRSRLRVNARQPFLNFRFRVSGDPEQVGELGKKRVTNRKGSPAFLRGIPA